MRFASLGGSGNFAQSGVAAGREGAKIFNAVRTNSPDFGSLAEKQMDIKAKQNVAQIKADSYVDQANIKADAKVSVAKEDIKQDNIIKGSRRKAGVVAAMGKAGIGMADMFMGKEKKADYSSYDAKIKAARDGATALRTQADGINTEFKPATTAAPANTGGTGATNASTTSSSAQPMKSGETAMNMMRDLTADGYSATQAAAITGNAQYESANFTAHEEYAPNAYGTKGAGYFQWTNAGGSNRRDNFENYAKNNKLDPRSYQANTGFMMHELKGGAGQHWTGGMNDQGFRQIGDLSTAVTSFQNNYLRPAKETANTTQRLSNAQNILQQFQQQNS